MRSRIRHFLIMYMRKYLVRAEIASLSLYSSKEAREAQQSGISGSAAAAVVMASIIYNIVENSLSLSQVITTG